MDKIENSPDERNAWTKSGQEGRDEWSTLKMCSEDLDA